MVDAGDYIDGKKIRFDLLASTMLASLLLQMWGGAALVVTEVARVPATTINELLASVSYVLTTAIAQPTAGLRVAWSTAASALPNLGPLTVVAAFVLIAITWRAQQWVLARVEEGITG